MRNGGPAPEVAEKPHELVVYGGIGRAGLGELPSPKLGGAKFTLARPRLCDGHHKMADYARGDRAKG
jgi:hypothetical protein